MLDTTLSEPKPEILSDEQIEQLLQEAEDRLQQKAGLEIVKLSEVQTQQRPKIPSLQHGLDRATYITEHNGVAKADPNLLINKEQEKMAHELRPVKKGTDSKKAVCRYVPLLFKST